MHHFSGTQAAVDEGCLRTALENLLETGKDVLCITPIPFFHQHLNTQTKYLLLHRINAFIPFLGLQTLNNYSALTNP